MSIEWKPIDTAPKDGAWVKVRGYESVRTVVCAALSKYRDAVGEARKP